jgi:hypothetical protein
MFKTLGFWRDDAAQRTKEGIKIGHKRQSTPNFRSPTIVAGDRCLRRRAGNEWQKETTSHTPFRGLSIA